MNQERILLLKSFIEEEPNNPFNHYALAMEYIDAEPTRSIEILELLRNQHPSYLPTYYKLAHLYWDFENWSGAGEVFQLGIELAKEQNESKTLSELQSAYQNFQFERD